MHGVCLQTKPSKTVLSIMLDKRMVAYGVKLKSHLYSLVKLTPKNFPFYSKICENFIKQFEGYLEYAFKTTIKFPFKRKACQVYEGVCCMQVSTVVSLVVW